MTVSAPGSRSLSDVLRSSARRYGDRPALVGSRTTLSYLDLDARVDAFASRFHAGGAVAGDRVGMCVERGVMAVVASAALMRLGCAYVPLDPTCPRDRQRHIVTDAGMALAVCDEVGRAALRDSGVASLEVDADELAPARRPGESWPGPDPDATAYVMYTSGSTGLPKGVEVTHANLIALLADALPLFPFAGHEVWPLQHAHGFDVSVWEMWAGIAAGATLVAVEGEARTDPGQLAELLLSHQATRLHIVPSVFQQLAEVVEEEGLRVPLRGVTFCGEAVNYHAMRSWTRSQPGRSPDWYNVYGITETTVYNTFARLGERELAAADPATPIGRGYRNSPVVVLDERLRPAPPGHGGEIFVGGSQVARGYLGNPELTAKRFLSLPDRPGRWYRTGDFGHVDEDGCLRFTGRQDDQVKVRGFRIELGELDHAARGLPWVADAAAVVQSSVRGEPVLALFVVCTEPVPDLRQRVRAALAERLPEHMVPVRVVGLPRLPRNANGKRDRRALRAMSSF